MDFCSFTIYLFLFFVYVLISVWMYVHHVCARTQRSQKRELDPPDLELQMVLSCPVGAWNRIQVLWNSSKCSQPLSCLFNLTPYVLKQVCKCFSGTRCREPRKDNWCESYRDLSTLWLGLQEDWAQKSLSPRHMYLAQALPEGAVAKDEATCREVTFFLSWPSFHFKYSDPQLVPVAVERSLVSGHSCPF